MKKWILIIFSCVCLITAIAFFIFHFVFVPKRYIKMVNEYSQKYNIEPALVYAIIKAESGFNPKAKSQVGAMGLMQIMQGTGKWIASELNEDFSENNLCDPKTNIRYGCFYLNYLFKKFGNMGAVICAYNAGEGAIRPWLNENGEIDEDKISFSETKNYYKKVMKYYKLYKSDEIF